MADLMMDRLHYTVRAKTINRRMYRIEHVDQVRHPPPESLDHPFDGGPGVRVLGAARRDLGERQALPGAGGVILLDGGPGGPVEPFDGLQLRAHARHQLHVRDQLPHTLRCGSDPCRHLDRRSVRVHRTRPLHRGPPSAPSWVPNSRVA